MRDLGDLGVHLGMGATTLCRCWKLTRQDGVVMGFTDHDRDIDFNGLIFMASTGLDAAAIQSSTGLSVDNSQAVGALSDFGLDETDIRAGKYDGAEVSAYLVNWRVVDERVLQFRGTIGEIRRSGQVFEAELRGLAETLNQAQGPAYHKKCSAVLGDAACGFDLDGVGYWAEIAAPAGAGSFSFDDLSDFDVGWFSKGVLRVLSGDAIGLIGVIRRDQYKEGLRVIDLWADLPISVADGDLVRLEAGCDKTVDTCRFKFLNFLNYRGFPNIPGDDWAMSYPTSAGVNDGGSLS